MPVIVVQLELLFGERREAAAFASPGSSWQAKAGSSSSASRRMLLQLLSEIGALFTELLVQGLGADRHRGGVGEGVDEERWAEVKRARCVSR